MADFYLKKAWVRLDAAVLYPVYSRVLAPSSVAQLRVAAYPCIEYQIISDQLEDTSNVKIPQKREIG